MEKELPHSIECEQWLLWALIIENWNYSKITVKEDDFYEDNHKIIFKIIKTLIDYGKCADLIMIRDFIVSKWLEKETWWMMYLVELSEIWWNYFNFFSYDSRVKELSERRKIIKEWRKLEKIWYNDDINNIFEKITKISDNFEVKKEKWNTIFDLCNAFEKYKDDFKNRGKLGDSSPYEVIDKYTGWIIKGKVYTIAWYSWTGKSNFCYPYVNNAIKQGKKVIFFSLEVQKEMLFNLLLKNYYNVSQRQILSNDFVYDLESFKNLIVYDTIYKLEEIKAICKIEKPDIIFIDFIQNVQTQWMWEYEKMTQVARELQQLAIIGWITIISISQVNNESRFKWSDKIQPKWSWAIFESSDVIFWLSRDWKNLQLNLLKNKYGMSDKNFLVIPDFTKIQFNITKEIQNEEVQKEETDFTI